MSGAPRTPNGTLGNYCDQPSFALMEEGWTHGSPGGEARHLVTRSPSTEGPRVDHLRTDLGPPSHRLKRRPNGTSLRPSDVREGPRVDHLRTDLVPSTNDWVHLRVRADSKGHDQGSGCCPACLRGRPQPTLIPLLNA